MAPMVAENLPAAQSSSHSAEPAVENLPAVQSLSSHKVAPMVAENLPAAQSSHSAEPAAENLPAVQSISSIGWVFFGAGAFFCLGLTCFEPASAGAAGFGGMAKQLGARRNFFMKGNF